MPNKPTPKDNQADTDPKSALSVQQPETQIPSINVQHLNSLTANLDSEYPSQSSQSPIKFWLLRYSQIILSALTFAVLIFTALQWNDYRDTRKLEYRAYVAVKGVALVTRPQEPNTSDLIVKYVNTGRTPGLKATIQANLEARETPISDEVSYNSNDVFRSKMVLFPQTDVQTILGSQTDAPPIPIPTQTTIPSVTNSHSQKQITPDTPPVKVIVQTKKYYAYGIIEYEDVFGHKHWTKFCYLNTPGTREWLNCANYNDAN